MTKLSKNLANKVDKNGKKAIKTYGSDISTNQIRQIYAKVKQAENRYHADGDIDAAVRNLKLIKPQLAYQSARNPETEEFKNWFIDQVDKVVRDPSEKRLEYFFRIMEAVVAYHYCDEKRGSMEFEFDKKSINNIDTTAENHAQQYYEQDIKPSQLRHVYGEIKHAQTKYRQQVPESQSDSIHDNVHEAKKSLQLLLPHLAYFVGRHPNTDQFVTDVRGWIQYAVDGSQTELEQFFELMEAIVAYHKYYTEMEEEKQ